MNGYVYGLRIRSDNRYEVATSDTANAAWGCEQDTWCILTNGHTGACCDDREWV